MSIPISTHSTNFSNSEVRDLYLLVHFHKTKHLALSFSQLSYKLAWSQTLSSESRCLFHLVIFQETSKCHLQNVTTSSKQTMQSILTSASNDLQILTRLWFGVNDFYLKKENTWKSINLQKAALS